MPSRKIRVRVKPDPYMVVGGALGEAIQSGMNKCDKYGTEPLTETQRSLLLSYIDQYFWVNLEESGVVIE
jgi:hypothetical protein